MEIKVTSKIIYGWTISESLYNRLMHQDFFPYGANYGFTTAGFGNPYYFFGIVLAKTGGYTEIWTDNFAKIIEEEGPKLVRSFSKFMEEPQVCAPRLYLVQEVS